MKTAPVANPRQLTPAFDYAMKFCQYGWVSSIDDNGAQSKSLASLRLFNVLDAPMNCGDVPLYQVHELPVLDEVKSENSPCIAPSSGVTSRA